MSIQCAVKSRVETQFSLKLPPIPAQYTSLILPSSNCTKSSSSGSTDDEILSSSSNAQPQALHVTATVLKSDGSEPEVCASCRAREVKRYQRRKSCAVLPDCVGKILVFHSPICTKAEKDLQVRLTCYCRHHSEPNGFTINLRFTDESTGETVLTAATQPIMITDDHKSVIPAPHPPRSNSISTTTSSSSTPYKRRRSVSPFSPQMSSPVLSSTLPVERIIPPSGPITGSNQVTLLGVNLSRFSSVSFGALQAPIIASYGHGSVLVVLSPPASHAGPVQVYLDGEAQGLTFTYEDSTDKAVLELALQVVGLGLTGRVESAQRVAMAIINSSPTGQAIHNAKPTQDNLVSLMSLVDEIPHLVNKEGQSILHLSAANNYPHFTKHLLSRGANPNLRDSCYRTPLHLAAAMERNTVARLLLNSGASNDLRDRNGDTAAKLGSRMGWSQIGALIRRFRKVPTSEESNSSSAGCTDEGEWETETRSYKTKLSDYKDLIIADTEETETEIVRVCSPSLSQSGRPKDLLPTPMIFSSFTEAEKSDSWISRTETKLSLFMDKLASKTTSPPPYIASAACSSTVITIATAPTVPKSIIFRRTGDTRVLTIWAPMLIALLLWAVFHYAPTLSGVIQAVKGIH